MEYIIGFIVLVGIIALFLFRPTHYRVDRSITINKPISEVFPLALDLHKRDVWSPWLCMDDKAKVIFQGDGSEIGDSYSWEGEFVGSGQMTITEIHENQSVIHDLEFLKPFKSKATVGLDFKPTDDNSSLEVTWWMEGKIPNAMKSMMAVWIGMDFERGLSMLKEWLETGKVLSKSTDEGQVDCPEMLYVGLAKSCAFEEISQSMQSAMSQMCERTTSKSITSVAPPLCIYKKYDMKLRQCDYEVCFPVASLPKKFADGASWIVGKIPAHKALKITHQGAYQNLGNAWSMGFNRLRALKLKQIKSIPPYEIYLSDPETTSSEAIKTELFWPLRG